MDCIKVRMLILRLQKEKRLIWKQLADAINISNKTISKLKRGLGCPDVSLHHELSDVLYFSYNKHRLWVTGNE